MLLSWGLCWASFWCPGAYAGPHFAVLGPMLGLYDILLYAFLMYSILFYHTVYYILFHSVAILAQAVFSKVLAGRRPCSMPVYCKGCFPSGRACRSSRAQPGQRATIKGPCPKCKESRCRFHCRCNRAGVAVGRSAPRGARARVAFVPAGAPDVFRQPSSSLPIGRPAALSVQLLDESTFFDDLFAELDGASEVHAATFQYDHPELHRRFLRCLRGGMHLDLVVDRQVISTCRGMKTRLEELKKAGGKVWLRDGHNHQSVYGPAGGHLTGHMHKKIVVIDKRVGYLGGMNLTRSALTNGEAMCKFKGPFVQKLLEAVLAYR